MKLTNLDRAIIAGLIIATIANLFSDSLKSVLPNTLPTLQGVVFALTAALIAVWLIVLIGRHIVERITAGKYAVEALILNEKNELLLFYHPTHQKHIPPAGRVNSGEVPDEAVKNRLQERLGLTPQDYRYHGSFHDVNDVSYASFERVIRVPAPFLVQREKRRQRGYVKYHYDFFYVLELTNPNPIFLDNEYGPPIWVDLEELKLLVEKDKTFPDVLDAYGRVLSRL